MKYFLRILLVLFLAVVVVFSAYFYSNGGIIQNNNDTLTTVTKQPATEKDSDRVLLSSLEQDGIYLYKQGDKVVLVNNGEETEFDNWSSMIDASTPQLYYENFDSDDDKEIIVRAVSSVNSETNEYIYDLYVLNPVKTDSTTTYNVLHASSSTWNEVLTDMVKQEISQLKMCDKFIQVAMIVGTDNSIHYNKDTGIAEDGYSNYAKALQKSDGSYYQLDKWSRGNGVYTVEDGKISVDIGLNISYQDTSLVQNIGDIHFELYIDDDNDFAITKKSMVFVPKDEYKVSDPETSSSKTWKYVETNKSTVNTNTNDKVIDWVKYSPEFDSSVSERAVYYANQSTEINDCSKVVVTNSYVELTASDGFKFAKDSVQTGEYSVTINEGTDDEYEISYSAEIKQGKSGEVLRINFDKSYPKKEIKTIHINYGIK
jgi:hypothetical protein